MAEGVSTNGLRRRSIWLIVAAALMPLLLFAAFQVGYGAREKRRATEAQALAEAAQLVTAADGETTRIATVLDALATSSLLRGAYLTPLADRFRELARLNRDLRGLEITDRRSGKVLLAVGTQTPIRTFVADGGTATRPVFVGYARARGCRCLMFARAAVDRGNRHLALSLLTDADLFLRLLPPARRNFEVSAYAGPRARFIARTLDGDRRFGQLGSRYLQAAVMSGKQTGIYRGFTLEGFENYTAFARSKKTGWTAHVALNSSYIDAPDRQFLASLALAVLISIALAALLIVFALRQIAEGRLLAERLQQGQKLEALGQLTGGIAHDFNNLLTPIVGVLDQLSRREALDDRSRKLAAGALASADRAAKLTAQLLAFSRRQSLQIVPVDVRQIVAEVTEMTTRSFGAAHHFTVRIYDEVASVATDPVQLQLALLNLALNARDASPEGATIELSVSLERPTSSDDATVLFTMRDRGSGMSADTQRRALEPFFTTKPVGQGTGLGLAQVLGVVEQSGGSLSIDSELGRGTDIIVRLPHCANASAPPTDLPVDATRETHSSLKLLVVDDDAAVRATIARLLEAEGHSVDCVSRGTVALAALQEDPFDLMIVDFQMSGMNGAELLLAARLIRPDIPALVVTGYADTRALEDAGLNVPRLSKPFTTKQLVAAVVNAARVRDVEL